MKQESRIKDEKFKINDKVSRIEDLRSRIKDRDRESRLEESRMKDNQKLSIKIMFQINFNIRIDNNEKIRQQNQNNDYDTKHLLELT